MSSIIQAINEYYSETGYARDITEKVIASFESYTCDSDECDFDELFEAIFY